MSEVCGDNRFELIGEFKGKLVEGTNIETSPEEMAVLDNILFRFWQMGWLDKLKAQEPVIRCEDCLYWKSDMLTHFWKPCDVINTDKDWYCPCGKRR